MKRALGLTVALLLHATLADGGLRRWQPLGPGTAGSIVRSIAIDPANPGTLLIASPGGGIWRTLDGGGSWQHVSADLPSQVVSVVAMAPSDPSIVFAGTGESFARVRGGAGVGLFRSVDGGASWALLPSTASWAGDLNRYVNDVAVHPTNPDLVIVATDAALQRSTDGGLTWESPPPWTGRVKELHWYNASGHAVAGLEPNGPGIEITPPAIGEQLDVALYSTDYGATWQSSNFGGAPVSTDLCAPASASDDVLLVDSAADFEYLDFIEVGSAGSAEVVQVLSAVAACDCCHGADGCSDNACNSAVIAVDASCEGDWDAGCDVLASQHCSCCSTDCPAGSDRLRLRGPHLTAAHPIGAPIRLKVSQRVALGINGTTLRTIASAGAGGGTLWGSNDLGANYSFISNPNAEDGEASFDYLMSGTNARAFYSNAVWVAPDPGTGEEVIVVAGVEAIRSRDGGQSFAAITRGVRFDEGTSAHIDHHALVADPRFPTVPTLYFGNDGGVQRADDIFTVQQESGWTNLACLGGIEEGGCPGPHDPIEPHLGLGQFWCGETTSDGEWLLAGGQDIDAVVRGSGEGANDWVLWNGVGDARGCAIQELPTGEVDMYILRNNQVRKINYCEAATPNPPAACTQHSDCPDSPSCSDGSCECISENQSGDCPAAPCNFSDINGDPASDTFTRAIAADPNSPSTLVAGGNRIWRTSDRGASWNEIRASIGSRSSALAVSTGDATIWAGYQDGRISRTQSGLTDWIDLPLPPVTTSCNTSNTCAVSDILIAPEDSQRVWVTLNGDDFDFRNDCCSEILFMTDDGGATWTSLMGTAPHTLPPTAAYSVERHPTEPDWIYVGTDRGVYASEDGGTSWGLTPIDGATEGPFEMIVTDLSWHDPDYLIATTYGLGMHRARAPRVVFVDGNWSGSEQGTEPLPFDTVLEAIDLAGHGATISIAAGSYVEGGISFTRRGRVVATGGDATID